jgi:hypothetical protein
VRQEAGDREEAEVRLIDGQGTCLDLDIMGYQFAVPDQGVNLPSLTYSDCNWLMVRGSVVLPAPGKSWEFMDPCLNTVELENLADWFNKISRGPIPRTISFMEPNLRLSFSSLPSPAIKITLSHESSSPWNKRTFPGFDELSFPAGCNDLAQIASELHDLAAKFPPRNGGS